MADSAQWPGDFESLARKYWTAWGETMRTGATPSVPHGGAQGLHEAVDWWSRLAHGGRGEVNDAVEKFNAQTRNWYGQMQQVAAQFAGQNGTAADITREWKKALGAVGENPFPEMFRSMRGHGQQGLDQWVEDASPYLDAWRREGASLLKLPAFGFAREQQERTQALLRAQVDYQEKTSAYEALMLKASQGAYELFESKLAEREEPGRQLTSSRALFDLWIDAAEEAYAGIALSPEFRKVYGELVNAQMRLRSGVQKEVEQLGVTFGMPTRTEVDSAHRKIAELERALRRLRDAMPEPVPSAPLRPSPAGKPAPGKAAARTVPVKGRPGPAPKAVAAKPSTRTPASAKPAVRKPAASKPVAKKTSQRKR